MTTSRRAAPPSSPRSAPARTPRRPRPLPAATELALRAFKAEVEFAGPARRSLAQDRLSALVRARPRRRAPLLSSPAADRRDPGAALPRLRRRGVRPILSGLRRACLELAVDAGRRLPDPPHAPDGGRAMSGADVRAEGRRAPTPIWPRGAPPSSPRSARDRSQAGARPRRPAAAARPVFVREKSVGTAYLLWFFFGGLSAHRFYLGFPQLGRDPADADVRSAMACSSASRRSGSWSCSSAGLWLLVDAFLIPGHGEKANERRPPRRASASVFA